jgi:hypothetical protein
MKRVIGKIFKAKRKYEHDKERAERELRRWVGLDATLAKKFPGIFPHLAFHIATRKDELFRYLDISAQGKNTRTPAYASAMLAYKEIFGTVMTGDNARVETLARRNLMDILVDDVKRTRKSLNSREKGKLDH